MRPLRMCLEPLGVFALPRSIVPAGQGLARNSSLLCDLRREFIDCANALPMSVDRAFNFVP